MTPIKKCSIPCHSNKVDARGYYIDGYYCDVLNVLAATSHGAFRDGHYWVRSREDIFRIAERMSMGILPDFEFVYRFNII